MKGSGGSSGHIHIKSKKDCHLNSITDCLIKWMRAQLEYICSDPYKNQKSSNLTKIKRSNFNPL